MRGLRARFEAAEIDLAADDVVTLPMRRLLVLAVLVFALDAHGAPLFIPLGYLPGGIDSSAGGVSADGSVIVGSLGP